MTHQDVLKKAYAKARKVVVAVVGTSILLIGIAMVVLPGPAILVIPLGIAVLDRRSSRPATCK
jgi:tellurite resistance protein TerC